MRGRRSAAGRSAAVLAALPARRNAPWPGRWSRAAASVDELVAATGQPGATVLGALTALEVRGLVVEAFGRYRAAGALAAPRRVAAGPHGAHPGARGDPAGGVTAPEARAVCRRARAVAASRTAVLPSAQPGSA